MSPTLTKVVKQKSLVALVPSSASRSGSEDEDYEEDHKGLENSMQRFSRHLKKIANIKKMKRELTDLTNTLSEKNKEIESQNRKIQELETDIKNCTRRFSDQCIELNDTNKQKIKELEIANKNRQEQLSKETITAKRETTAAQNAAGLAKANAKARNEQLAIAKDEIQAFRRRLQNSESKLSKLKDDIGFNDPEENLSSAFESLSSTSHHFAKTYFGIPISELCPPDKNDELFMSLQQSRFSDVIPQAIPISDSPESGLLRAAAVETIIAECLTVFIFSPVFPFSSNGIPQICTFERLHDERLSSSPQKEAMLRTLISTTESTDQKMSTFKQVEQVLTGKCLPFLELFKKNRKAEFDTDLAKLLEDAWQTWKCAQKSEINIKATLNNSDRNFPWEEREEHEGTLPEDTPHARGSGFPKAILFPQVYKVQEEIDVLHHGWIILSGSSLYQAAKKEFEIQHYRHPANQSTQSLRRHRGKDRI